MSFSIPKSNHVIRNITLLFFLLSVAALAQKPKNIVGKVIVRDGSAYNIHIVNLVNENEVATDADGNFTILGSEGDILVLSGNHIDYVRRTIREDDYTSGKMTIKIAAKPIELAEVEVTKADRMDAVSLGILTKPAKQYTPAERKVFTATSTALDGLLNRISGRAKKLKREAILERKEMLLEQLDGLWPDAWYADLGIEKDRIRGFHYMLVDNKEFIDALASDNTTQMTFITLQTAEKYNGTLNVKE